MNAVQLLRYTIYVALGGAIGAGLRFWITELMRAYFKYGFLFGTLLVNVLGSFLIGFLSIVLFRNIANPIIWRCFLLIGVLGGFTTFSTFSLDTVNLLMVGKMSWAFFNVLFSVILCVMGAYFGVWLAEFVI